MNKLKMAIAVLLLGCSLHAHESKAVMLIANGTEQVEWYVGKPAPAIDEFTEYFSVGACGAELAWVYENFPTIPMRTVGGTLRKGAGAPTPPPAENQCVFWRGDIARFIADNLDVTTNW